MANPTTILEVRQEPGDLEAVPTTPHTAYVAGWNAARRGDDLATVIYDAVLRWPMGSDVREWCELVACTSLGFWAGDRHETAENRRANA